MTIVSGERTRDFRDLAPQILRQRLVIEGYPALPISDDQIKDYLNRLSNFIGMRTLLVPVTHRSDLYGWAGWIHWETSGAHFYVDVALEFTRRYFEASDITYKSF